MLMHVESSCCQPNHSVEELPIIHTSRPIARTQPQLFSQSFVHSLGMSPPVIRVAISIRFNQTTGEPVRYARIEHRPAAWSNLTIEPVPCLNDDSRTDFLPSIVGTALSCGFKIYQ